MSIGKTQILNFVVQQLSFKNTSKYRVKLKNLKIISNAHFHWILDGNFRMFTAVCIKFSQIIEIRFTILEELICFYYSGRYIFNWFHYRYVTFLMQYIHTRSSLWRYLLLTPGNSRPLHNTLCYFIIHIYYII